MKLLEKQKLIYNREELLELLDKSIILLIDEKKELYKLDESVMMHLHEQMEYKQKRDILSDMLDCISESSEGSAYSYLATVIEKVVQCPVYLEGLMEMILTCVEYYANAGYWNELHAELSNSVESPDKRLMTLAIFEEIIYERRSGNLEKAYELSICQGIKKDEMGVWYYMYYFLCIQIRHLQGYYEESIVRYKQLLEEMDLIRSTIPVHIYNMVAMKYADLLFLKGEFNLSLNEVEKLLAREDTPLIDQIELLRIKGHIYRFNKQYAQAKIID
jgi:hypothetical protein